MPPQNTGAGDDSSQQPPQNIHYIYDIGSLVPQGLPSKEEMIRQFQEMFGPKVVPVNNRLETRAA